MQAEALDTAVAAMETAIEALRVKLEARGVTVDPGVLSLSDADGDHLGLIVAALRVQVKVAQDADGVVSLTPQIVRGRRTRRYTGESKANVRELDLDDLADRVNRE